GGADRYGLITRSRPSLFTSFTVVSPPSANTWTWVGSSSPPTRSPAPIWDAPSFTFGLPSPVIRRSNTVSGYGLPFHLTLGSSGSTDRLARTLAVSSA